jgi:putative PIG3 family NAD(P)H quinone oxidoreductase
LNSVLPYRPRSGPEPRLGEVAEPVAAPGEVLLAVRAAGLNRADLLQLRGHYPPPPGESEVPGLEAAGEIVALGAGVDGWRVGDRAAALLAGGGQAERVAVPAGQLIEIPPGWSFETAAALPEAALTSWTNLVVEGRLAAGQVVLISGATSGVGTFAVQLARELGAEVIAAGRDAGRLERLRELGAGELVELGEGLGQRVRTVTAGRGADLVLDLVGGEHLPLLLAALAPRGRLILVGLMAGRSAEIDLGTLLARRLTLVGSVLRSRDREEKAELVRGFVGFAAPRLTAGRLEPRIDRVFPFAQVAEAYRYLEHGRPLGKVVLRLSDA